MIMHDRLHNHENILLFHRLSIIILKNLTCMHIFFDIALHYFMLVRGKENDPT